MGVVDSISQAIQQMSCFGLCTKRGQHMHGSAVESMWQLQHMEAPVLVHPAAFCLDSALEHVMCCPSAMFYLLR